MCTVSERERKGKLISLEDKVFSSGDLKVTATVRKNPDEVDKVVAAPYVIGSSLGGATMWRERDIGMRSRLR